MPLTFDTFKSFGNDELTAKQCYFRCSRPTGIDGIKIFDQRGQEETACVHLKAYATTTVSYLYRWQL